MCKKLTKIVAIMLAFMLCAGSMEARYASAKSIYFAGEYRKQTGKGEYYILEMNKYSSAEGKIVGNYKLYYYYKPYGGMNLWEEGEIKKSGKNTYKTGGTKFKVYKKKVVIKNGVEI